MAPASAGDERSTAIGDVDGNGTLEIVLTTFDHGLDVYTVPGSRAGSRSAASRANG